METDHLGEKSEQAIQDIFEKAVGLAIMNKQFGRGGGQTSKRGGHSEQAIEPDILNKQ